jgi:uncharacterized membrane-anchored protein
LKKYNWLLILLNLVLLLVYTNYSVKVKEGLMEEGQLVLLELAPVDPRSLMQGDYMDLRYKISEDVVYDSLPARGYCIVRLNEMGVASKVRFQKDLAPLGSGEHPIRYTLPDQWRISIGAESFFFQEGAAEKFEQAKYGGLKIDRKGNSLLVGLYNEQLRKIE